MAATTLAPHNSPPLSPGPSPGPSPHLVPSSCLPAPSATPSHPILLVPHHAYQHPSIPDATQPLASGASTTPASAPDDKPAADLGPRVGSKSRSGSRKGSRRPSSEGSHFKAGRVQPGVRGHEAQAMKHRVQGHEAQGAVIRGKWHAAIRKLGCWA
eukprot:1161696-Pelagomonas_calceolata.AAC.26